MITPRQVFNGIAISVGLHLLTYVGLLEMDTLCIYVLVYIFKRLE